MAVANSDFDNAAGKTHKAAIRYDIQTYGPVTSNASPGRTKIPEPSIDAILIEITDDRPKFLSSFFKNILSILLGIRGLLCLK